MTEIPRKMPWNKKEKWAPFARDELLSYPSFWTLDFEWKEVSKPFAATLRFCGHGRGRSAVVFKWVDIYNEPDGIYPMFVSDLSDILLMYCKPFRTGPTQIVGLWEVVKKGANFGIRLVK